MKRRIFTVGILIAALVAVALELLPSGAVLYFRGESGEVWDRYYSYFSLTPFGYAVFGPLISAWLSVVLVVLSAFMLRFKSRALLSALRITAVAATAISLTPMLFGVRYFTLIGAFVTLTLAIASGASFFVRE